MAVHNRVQDNIGQVIRAHASEPPSGHAYPFLDRRKQLILFFFEHKDKAVQNQQTDLLIADLEAVFLRHQALENNKQVVIVLFKFGPLMCVQNILDNQRMDTEGLAYPDDRVLLSGTVRQRHRVWL